jgi:hypothetical protein
MFHRKSVKDEEENTLKRSSFLFFKYRAEKVIIKDY